MKTTNPKNSTIASELFITGLKFLIIVLILFQPSTFFGQKYKRKERCYLRCGVDNVSSGNSHGSFLSPHVVIKKGRTSYNLGVLFQNRGMQLNGGKLSFSYILSDPKKNNVDEDEVEAEEYVAQPKRQILQLNIFAFSQYVHNGLLSAVSSITEQKASSQPEMNWNQVRLSTAEAGIGFELYVKLTKRVSWKNYVAGSVYYHVTYVNGMYNERNGPSLVLGTGIVICPL
ncbi:MAG: hypothetical protein HYX39_01340 [Bacteroidetes bacterium]|nr:hypothetical protein [Bacteroidota bacterium]